MTQSTSQPRSSLAVGRTAFLFDLDGTLVDNVYQHVLAWHEAMVAVGLELAVWTIHRRIGMSGGLMANAVLRETGHEVTTAEAGRLLRLHAERTPDWRARFGRCPARGNCSPTCRRSGYRGRSRQVAGSRAHARPGETRRPAWRPGDHT